MGARHSRTEFRPGITVSLVLLLVLAGCSGVSAPGTGAEADDSITTVDPPLSESEAEERARFAEHEYVFTEKVPADADASGTGGVSTTKAVAVAGTDAGRFVRVRFAFWYTKNTSDGELHADGVAHSVYFITPNDTTRVSVSGDEMKGSSVVSGDATLELQVVNADDEGHEVSLTVEQVDGNPIYERDTSVAGQRAAHTPRLSVPPGEVVVVATIAGKTKRLRVTAASGEAPQTQVSVFIDPEGTVVIEQTPYRL